MAYDQYILPLIPRSDEYYEIRINKQSYQPRVYDRTTHLPAKNRDFYLADQSKVCYISEKVLVKGGITPLDANISVDGQLTPAVRSVQLLDYLTYSGFDGTGAAVAEAAPAGGSLFEEIFEDRSAIHTIFFSRRKSLDVPVLYNSGTAYDNTSLVYHHGDWWELGKDAPVPLTGAEPGGSTGYTENTATWVRARHTYLIADIKGDTVTADEFCVIKYLDNAGHIQERIQRTVRFECDSAAIRLQSHVVEDMFEFVTLSDMVLTTPLPAYGGIVNIEGTSYLDGSKNSITANDLWQAQMKQDARCIPAGVSVNDGLHYIPLATLVKKFADTCDFEHSTVTDLKTGMQYWIDKVRTVATDGSSHPWIVASFTTNQAERTPLAFEVTSTNINSSTYYSGASIFDALAVCYEWVVGSNPLCDLHVQRMSSDVSYDWNSPLSEAVARFTDGFLQYCEIDINQSTKKPIFRLLDRRDFPNTDTLPTSLQIGKDAKRLQTNVSAQHVEVSNRGFGDKVACPNRRGKAIDKEVAGAAKLRGRKGTLSGDDSQYNASLSADQQYSCWKTFTGGLKKGGHIICDDATVTEIAPSSSGHHRYSITSPSIDAWILTGGDQEGNGGDIVAWHNVSTQVVGTITSRNTFIVSCYAGETIPTGSGKSFAAGYDIFQTDGVIDTDDATDFHSATRSFIPYIGRNLYIPSRGIFRILSATDVAGVYHCTVDAPLGKAGTSLTFRLGTAGQNIGINPDGFVAGAFLYVYDSSPSAAYILNGTNDMLGDDHGTELTDWVDVGTNSSPLLVHPGALNKPYSTVTFNKGATDGDWSGMYAVSRCCFGLPDSGTPDTPPDYSFGNTIAGPAQAWAAETVGVFASKQRNYDFNLNPFSGLLTNVKLLATTTITENGVTKTYYATGIKIDEFGSPNEEFVYTLTEKPSNASGPIDSKKFPVIRLGTGGATGNASSVGGGGGAGTAGSPANGGPVDLGNNVITKPGTPTRNKIYSQADDTPEIEGVRHSATSTADHAAFYTEDSLTKVFYVDKDGAQHIELQADVVGSVVRASSSQTADLQEWQNNSGTVKASISAAGTVTGVNVQATTLAAGNVVADGTGTLQNGAVDLSSVTGVLDVPHGGTGQSSFTSNTLLLGNGTSPIGEVTAGSNNDMLRLIGGVPSWVAFAANVDTSLQGDGGVTALGINLGHSNTWTAGQTFNGDLNIGGAEYDHVVTTTGDYNVGATDLVIFCDFSAANHTVTLPTSPTDGRKLVIVKIDSSSHTATVVRNGHDFVDSAADLAIGSQGSGVRLTYSSTAGKWSKEIFTSTGLPMNTVTTAKGGTGNTVYNPYGIVLAGSPATQLGTFVAVGTAGQIFVSNGSSAFPGFVDPTNVLAVMPDGSREYIYKFSIDLAAFPYPSGPIGYIPAVGSFTTFLITKVVWGNETVSGLTPCNWGIGTTAPNYNDYVSGAVVPQSSGNYVTPTLVSNTTESVLMGTGSSNKIWAKIAPTPTATGTGNIYVYGYYRP